MAWTISNTVFYTVIFLSGFSALIYQLVWVRILGLVFGVSSFAVATVVSVFLLGLGCGSLYFGKLSEKIKNPLKAYLFVELCIGIFSIVSYLIINNFTIYKVFYEYSYNNFNFYWVSVIRLFLSIVVLFPPVFAIGGTIPLITKYFLTTPERFGSNFSRIYYINTLGAFAGSMLTGFIFVKYIGVFLTFIIAVTVNLLIALIIIAYNTESEKLQETISETAPYSYMLVILFTTGFISLSYEILWTRILSTYNMSTSQSFALILSGFLLGFSVGSYLISNIIDAIKNLELMFGKISILTAISGALVLLIFQKFEYLTNSMANIVHIDVFTLSLMLAFTVSFVPAIFMGVLFPLGLRIYANDINEIGIKTGNIFFFNTIGSVIGSVVTGYLLIPFVGMWNTTLILVNLSLLISFYMCFIIGKLHKKHFASLFIIFLISNSFIFSDRRTFHKEEKGFDVIYYTEGLSGTVTAIENNGYRGLFVDGQNVSGTDYVLTADSKMLGHLPLLIAENPKNALTVGYGTGATSYSMLLHGVDVDAVEIENKIIEAAHLFEKVNHHSYNNEKLDIIIDDARNYIDVVNEKFDVIVTDVTNLKYKRNPCLYTQEYFEIMKKALNEKGIAAAWLPIGGLSFNDLKILIRTFDFVFPHTTLWYFTQYPTHFIIAIGTPEKLKINLDKLEIDMKIIKNDLEEILVDNEYEIASMLLLGENDVDNLSYGTVIHTDNFPILEFSDMYDYMRIGVQPNLNNLMKYKKEDLNNYFIGSSSQLITLKQNFLVYNKHYRNYINEYYRRYTK
jgi:spermidine synthase